MPILQWLNRNETVSISRKVPYRLLEEDKQYSYGEESDNMVIQGDNLEALKALLPYYAGQVKCIYIDPPYNTRSAFEHYDDNLEHSKWVDMIYPRLELLREFLSDEGSIWVSIDDNEGHYLKVIMDEIFGRRRFIASTIWQKRYSRENREAIGDVHEYIVLYANDPDKFKKVRNRVPLDAKSRKVYKNPNNHPRGPWRAIPMTAQGWRPNQMYSITTPTGVVHFPPEGRCWSTIESEYLKLLNQGRIYFGKNMSSQPNIIRFLDEVEGHVPWTWWPHDEVGHTDEAKKESQALFGKDATFGTPKPERLIKRIIEIATNPGDIVLDSFLGSGTTAAVAHKMRRPYIGVEMGEHAISHVVPRMRKVVDGEQGGVSKDLDWQGGGGFRFYRLGEQVFDEEGIINKDIKFDALAAHIWFAETKTQYRPSENSPLLGVHQDTAYYLLYNGILGDKRANGGNVLTEKVLNQLPDFSGERVIFGEASRIGETRLKTMKITFRQLPYDIKMR
ncbi:MAG TPA: site-specific DNA-methyltransferase [Syntrophomonadaceae bacterium]|nr:site-specific DNA-methyltransferase [Syntrophomonadaceae bacterium]